MIAASALQRLHHNQSFAIYFMSLLPVLFYFEVCLNHWPKEFIFILVQWCSFENNPRLEGPELLGLASYDTNCSRRCMMSQNSILHGIDMYSKNWKCVTYSVVGLVINSIPRV